MISNLVSEITDTDAGGEQTYTWHPFLQMAADEDRTRYG